MKRVVVSCFLIFFSASPAIASQLNLDPYLTVGSSYMNVDLAGNKSDAPAFYLAAGTALNWISPNVGAEVRFGFGGQYNTFDGDINSYTSLLLKPGFDIAKNLGIYGLVGVTTMSVVVANTNYSDSGLSYGAGLSYYIPDESIFISGEWMNYHTSSDQSTTSITGMDITGISLSVTFEYY